MSGTRGMADISPPLPLDLFIYLLTWGVMMVAMMLPAISPMVLLFALASRERRAKGHPAVPTAIFILGYLFIWTCFGLIAYGIDRSATLLSSPFPNLHILRPSLIGAVLIGVGLYQWSSWKEVCLTHCRTPMSFVFHGWREGYAGAVKMGIHHGAYCVGCCWGLMALLVTVGTMNIAWMVTLSVIILIEKVSRYGERISRGVALLFILLGGWQLLSPIIP